MHHSRNLRISQLQSKVVIDLRQQENIGACILSDLDNIGLRLECRSTREGVNNESRTIISFERL